MKKICYATDCSRYSAPALRYAHRLGDALGARLHVLHTFDLPPVATAALMPYGKLLRRTRWEQQEVVAAYCRRHLGQDLQYRPVSIEVVDGDSISAGICILSEYLEPDLLIVGRKDSESQRAYFSGNIANELLNTLDVPLLILPNESYYHGLSTIVYATDFEETDVDAIRELVRIAEPLGAIIKVVHMPRKKEVDVQYHMDWLELEIQQQIPYPEITFTLLPPKDNASGLLSFVENEKADLLVMMEREHLGLLDRFFHKDLVRSMEAKVSVPLLAYNKRTIYKRNMEQAVSHSVI